MRFALPSRVLCLLVVASVLAAASTASCSSDRPADRAVLTDSAGVAVASDLGPDVPLDWRFERVLGLGGKDRGPEAFYDVSRGKVDTDSSGNIYVLDTGAKRVVVFDNEGRYLRALGREGEGPGEIALPLGFSVLPDGTVLVDDLGKGRLVGFGPDGDALDSEERVQPGSRRVYWDGGFYSSIVAPDSTGMRHRFLAVAGNDTTELAGLHAPVENRVVELPSCGMSFSGIPSIFAPHIKWDAWRARAAVRVGNAYEIDVYQEGRHVGRVRRAVSPKPATAELAERELGEAMTVMTSSGERRCDPAEVVEQRGFEGEMPAIRDLRVDPRGRIWVARAGPRPEPTPTDILGPDGSYVGTLSESAPYPIGFLPDGRALATETDDVDVTRLVVYEVQEVPSGFEPE